jgi:hypothetical protein
MGSFISCFEYCCDNDTIYYDCTVNRKDYCDVQNNICNAEQCGVYQNQQTSQLQQPYQPGIEFYQRPPPYNPNYQNP